MYEFERKCGSLVNVMTNEDSYFRQSNSWQTKY